MSRITHSTKPKKPKRFRSLSDPHTLSELALRLKEGIYITTLDGEIIDANPAFLEMFGVESLEELKGYRTSDFVRPEVRAREMAQLEREGSVRDVEDTVVGHFQTPPYRQRCGQAPSVTWTR